MDLKFVFSGLNETLSFEISKILIENKIDINKVNALKISPLMYSIYYSKNSVSKLLIEQGAEYDYRYDFGSVDLSQINDLNLFEYGHTGQFFIPSIFAFKDTTPLFISRYLCNRDMEEFLSKKSAESVNAPLVLHGIHSGQEYALSPTSKIINHIENDVEYYPVYDISFIKEKLTFKKEFIGLKINIPYYFSVDNVDNDRKKMAVIVSNNKPYGYLEIIIPANIKARFQRALMLFQKTSLKEKKGKIKILNTPYFNELMTITDYCYANDGYFYKDDVLCNLFFKYVPQELAGDDKYYDYDDDVYKSRDSSWLSFVFQIYYYDFIPNITIFSIDENNAEILYDYVDGLLKSK